MKNKEILKWLLFVAIIMGIFMIPELVMAQSGFENKIGGLTDKLITVVLPAVSILGLVYAALLAASGDAGARSRMGLVIFACIVGFLAPTLIGWFRSAVGG